MSSSTQALVETLEDIELQDKHKSGHSEEASSEGLCLYKFDMRKCFGYYLLFAAQILAIAILLCSVQFYYTVLSQDKGSLGGSCYISSFLFIVGATLLVITPGILLILPGKNIKYWRTCVLLVLVPSIILITVGGYGVKCYKQMDDVKGKTQQKQEGAHEMSVFKSELVGGCEDVKHQLKEFTKYINCNYCMALRCEKIVAISGIVFGVITLVALVMMMLYFMFLRYRAT